jgi:mannose-6-phosphate isomerase-like protein (cupin superfamily)
MKTINLQEALSQIPDTWHPRIVGALNDSYVKLVKLQGEFVWHHHESEDELFLVLQGTLTIQIPGGELVIQPGEFAIIPRGVDHRPVAAEEVHVLLLEPKSTLNTGSAAGSELTVEAEWLPGLGPE